VALANETATSHLMADLALLVGPGDVITLSGDLGAGKTAAARAMIRYLANDPCSKCQARHSRWRRATICRSRSSRRSLSHQ
jgi:Predicted ATPase or kinase